MQNYLEIGVISSSHGVRGEIKARSHSGEMTHFKPGQKILLMRKRGADLTEEMVEIESVRGALPNLIVKISGIDSPEKAAGYRGARLYIPRSQARALGEGEYYFADLTGCSLRYNGEALGVVKSVWENGNCDMLECQLSDGGVVQVPLQERFVGEIDIIRRTIDLKVDWIIE